MKLDFLKIKNKAIERKIENRISSFIKLILKKYDNNIESIILFGSIARNEITYNKNKLVSDFDFLIVTKIPLFLIKKDIKKIDNVNYEFCWRPFLKYVPKSTYWFDIKKTGKTIYGKHLLKEIYDFKKTDIPRCNSSSIVFNRITHLVSVFDPDYLNNKKIENKEQTAREACKAILCISDIISIFSGKYSPYFSKRIEIAKNSKFFFKKQNKDFVKDIELASKYIKHNKNINCLDLWFKAKDYLLFLIDFCDKNIHEKNKWIFFNYIRFYYNMLKIGIMPKIVRNPHLYWRMSILYLLKSVEKNNINQTDLNKSIKYLNRVCHCKISYRNVNEGWVRTKKEIEKVLNVLPEF